MFGLGAGELLIIAVVVLLALGPDKLPDAAKKIGAGIRDLKRQTRNLQSTIEHDTEIGDAVRDLKYAMRGEDPPKPRPKPRPVPKPVPEARADVDRAPSGHPPGRPAPAESNVDDEWVPDPDEPTADVPESDEPDPPNPGEPESSAHG